MTGDIESLTLEEGRKPLIKKTIKYEQVSRCFNNDNIIVTFLIVFVRYIYSFYVEILASLTATFRLLWILTPQILQNFCFSIKSMHSENIVFYKFDLINIYIFGDFFLNKSNFLVIL